MSDRLTPFELWMVKSNLLRIETGEQTKVQTVEILRGNGYFQIADAVSQAAEALGIPGGAK